MTIILHEGSERSKCTKVKGIKKGIKKFTRLYVDERACVCVYVCVCVSVCLSGLKS
jgi:hypothetical protein